MKEYIIANMEIIITLLTMIISLILGYISKKSDYVKNEIIPLQNLIIGLVVTIIYFICSGNINSAIAFSGIMAGGIYDIFHNIEKLLKYKKGE